VGGLMSSEPGNESNFKIVSVALIFLTAGFLIAQLMRS
jgi:hypothetical protein